MLELIQGVLNEFGSRFVDTRTQVFSVQVGELTEKRLILSGQVLEQTQLDALRQSLLKELPDLHVDVRGVRVLRQPQNPSLSVSVNLTSLHAKPSWLAEQLSQLLFGAELEVLDADDRWVYVRQTDGYLGWAYRPYLSADLPAQPTHRILAPISQVFSVPDASSGLITRLMAGTCVKLLETKGDWAKLQASYTGWVQKSELRPLDFAPKTAAERREVLVADAQRLLGVPYLWGGCSANGIDCSGLAQLAYRLQGIEILRDADMQYKAGRKVQLPYQPGDLLFYGERGDDRAITHVSISLGGWDIIHSSRSRNGVYFDNVQQNEGLRESFCGAATYLDEA
jgi:gamma-D-glutamyl-L-lysine dipeptidyl-peptidase